MSASVPDLQSFLDSLGTLGALLSLASEQVQDAGDEFVLNANEKRFEAFERSVTEERSCSKQLERQFNRIEYLVTKRLSVPDCCTNQAEVFSPLPSTKKLEFAHSGPDLIGPKEYDHDTFTEQE